MNTTVYVLWREDTRVDRENEVIGAYFKEEDASAELRRLFEVEIGNLDDVDIVDSFVGPLCSYIETHDGEVDYHIKVLEVK